MRVALTLFVSITAFAPAAALAWSPLRAENPNVKEGNRLMAEERYSEALEAYDRAARELPDAPGVQLNRGLALLAQDLTEPSKEALGAASHPSAPPDLRAAGYYNLGVAHARQGDALTEAEDFEGASAQFREAASAFKKALRTQPGNRNAAWNLEYALKRIREEEQKRQQEASEPDPEQEPDPDPDPEQQPDPDRAPEPDPAPEPEPDPGQDQQQEQEQNQNSESESDSESEPESESESDPGPETDPGREPEPEPEPESTPEAPRPSPAEVQRFLDALEQNEESLPLQRARRRSKGRRPPEKDW